MYYQEAGGIGTVGIIILIVVLLECVGWGIASALIAQKRGRNPLGWFFLGFGGIWFSLITLMLLPPLGGEYKKCPRCAEIIGIGAWVCPHCQYSFSQQGAA